MAANAPFTVADGVPEDHVFSPVGLDGGVASYQNLDEDMPSGRETVRFSKKDGKTVEEHVITLRMPKVVETTVDGVTRKVVENFGAGSAKLLIPPSWTPTERAALRTVLSGLTLAAPVQKLVDLGEGVW
jgi:hypothetical protein